MPLAATVQHDVEVGRVRKSLAFGDHGLEFFVSGDQPLRGAALNAVLVAEEMDGNGSLQVKNAVLNGTWLFRMQHGPRPLPSGVTVLCNLILKKLQGAVEAGHHQPVSSLFFFCSNSLLCCGLSCVTARCNVDDQTASVSSNSAAKWCGVIALVDDKSRLQSTRSSH
jgi:hypothetical protein